MKIVQVSTALNMIRTNTKVKMSVRLNKNNKRVYQSMKTFSVCSARVSDSGLKVEGMQKLLDERYRHLTQKLKDTKTTQVIK